MGSDAWRLMRKCGERGNAENGWGLKEKENRMEAGGCYIVSIYVRNISSRSNPLTKEPGNSGASRHGLAELFPQSYGLRLVRGEIF